MACQGGRRASDNRLPLIYDVVPGCHGSSAVVFRYLELAAGKSAAGLLRRYGFSGRLLLVCSESALRHQELPQRKNLVAQAMVGAGPRFILVFAHHRHRTGLSRKSCYLNSDKLLTEQNRVPE